MALTSYTIIAESVQLPNGRLALRDEVHNLESTKVSALLSAGLIKASVNFSSVEPPLLANTVFTAQTSGDLLRPDSSEDIQNMTGPSQLRSNISAKKLIEIVAKTTTP